MKSFTPLIVAGVVVVVGVGGYMAMSGNSSTSTDTTGTTATENMAADTMDKSDDSGFNGTFMDLLKLGKNYTCDFAHTDQLGNDISGTVWISAGKDQLRGDFVMKQPDGQEFDSHVIRDGDLSYVWSSMFPHAMKMKVDEDDHLWGNTENADDAPIDPSEEVDFDCKKWSVDKSKFAPPADIEFMDLSQQMEQIKAAEGMLEGIDCSVCDNVPDEAGKQACRDAMGC